MLELVYGWFVMSGIMELFISIKKRSRKQDRQESRDHYSLALLWLSTITGVSLAILIREIYGSWFSNESLGFITGLIVASTGILIRLTAIYQLKNEFTVNVNIAPNQQLKTDGLYTFLRHPSYSGLFCNFLGVGIAINNLWSLGFIVIPLAFALAYRIRIEEKLLLENFGESYRSYQRKTWALFPYIF